ncbi:MAG TPA: NADPH:quinone oxidoreductase family protein [Xanthobacteraceae bacterium]|nr:NADPH:quinone oxidoreductase family protein [Xanthobacteraceae bacterium]
MKAIVSVESGPPETLRLVDLPEPVPGPGEVLVAVAAIGLNFFDTLIIQDRYQFRPPRPFSPGAEFAGTVAALGPGVEGFAIGEPVCGYVRAGAARERLTISAERLAKVPAGVSLPKAAGLMVTYATALHALRDRGQLQPGETLAVLGAAGGVGLAAVELGRAMGARVIACASSPEKLGLARAHGADELVDYEAEDLRGRLKALTGGRGVDVLFDPVGSALAEPALRSMAWGGRYLVIGFAGGEIPRLPLNLLLLKGCDLRGVSLGGVTERHPERMKADLDHLLALLAQGHITAHIGATYPLAECAQAIADLAARKAQGKIVLLA